MAVKITRDLQKLVTGASQSAAGDAPGAEAVRIWIKMLSTALGHEEHKPALPSMHINTCLHASVRWNKAQQLRANDLEDFLHACSAWAYCDHLLTERRMITMVAANHLALDRQYNCKVAAVTTYALTLLRAE